VRDTGFTSALGGRIALAGFALGLLVLSYRVLHPFLVPLTWGLILVYVSWPLYRRLRAILGRFPNLGAFLMSLLLGLVFVLPLLWIVTTAQSEVPQLYREAERLLTQGPEILPPAMARLPWVGPELERILALAAEDPTGLRAQILQWVKPLVGDSLRLVGDLGAMVFKLGFALLSAFFLYRDGDTLLEQTRRVLIGFLGPRAESYLDAIGDTTRGVLYGLVLTALLQGILAGLGYWVAGLPTPILLAVLTTLLALVPFGTPVAMGAVCLRLFLTGELLAAVGLAAWATLVVSQIDNLIRPLVISSAAKIPYILVLCAVLGGIAAFGLVGLFIGPIVIAVLLAVWREWLAENTSRDSTPPA
jgi:predicted PurR-regulated permease PerM